MSSILTITQISSYIKSVLENDEKLQNIYITGEISNFTHHYKTGHFYLTLKDEVSTIRVVMFKTYANYVNFLPQNGMKIVVKGTINIYPPNGTYQINATEMALFGDESHKLAFDTLKNKLQQQGYFALEHKKAITKNPSVIALISATGSAGLNDVLSVINRRNPFCKIIVYNTIMQGIYSSEDVIKSIQLANNNKEVDVIVIARGGGSTEDLWSFNSEELAKVVFNSKKPIMSAIGHDVDYTILDFVADIRAGTPSIAGEIIVDDIRSIDFYSIKKNLQQSVFLKIDNCNNALLDIKHYNLKQNFNELLNSKIFLLKSKKENVGNCFKNTINDKIELLNNKINLFNAVNLYSVLKRGYSVATVESKVLNIDNVKVGQELKTTVNGGVVKSKITKIIKEEGTLNGD